MKQLIKGGSVSVGKEYAVFRDKDEIEVAYMRETDNRVYLYCGQLSPTHIMTDQETPIPDEILLYDFNLLDNDLFSVFAFGGGIQYNSTIPQYGESQECIVTEVTDTDSEWPLKQIDFCISAEYEGIHNEYIVHNFIEGGEITICGQEVSINPNTTINKNTVFTITN